MKVSLTDAGKRFNRDWIFRHFSYSFEEGISYAITGPNGSGKSTLLQTLGGSMLLSEGKIQYHQQTGNENPYPTEKIYQHVSFCAPYLELVEEMTLMEFLGFHQGFKPFLPSITPEKIIVLLSLEKEAHKQIRHYSSGMKQRVKLAQCILSDTPIVLLDEPCTNLDAEGIELYHRLIHDHCKDRLVVVSSNDEVEYRFCEQKINISQYKS